MEKGVTYKNVSQASPQPALFSRSFVFTLSFAGCFVEALPLP